MPNIAPLVNQKPRKSFCETETAKRIFTVLSYCNDHRDIGIIVGEPGVGKTTALKQFSRNSYSIHYCVMSPALSSMSASLRIICESMGIYVENRSADTHRILQDRDFSEKLLIVDEAQHLTNQTIDELRCIYDETNLAIVFCGNGMFHSRFNNTSAAAFGQFTSRVGMRLQIDQPTSQDMEIFCKHFEIEGKQARDLLIKYSKTTGGLRIVTKLIKLAEKLGDDKLPVKLSNLKDAAQLLGASL